MLMLLVGLPLYICATASTPVAAALLLKGASPGAALVFLLAGPATNLASITVLLKVLGRRATAIYLGSIAVLAIVCGLLLDGIYSMFGLSARALVGQAGQVIPFWLQAGSVALMAVLSVKPVLSLLRRLLVRRKSCCTESTCCSQGE